jgi:hypothetical protein
MPPLRGWLLIIESCCYNYFIPSGLNVAEKNPEGMAIL